MAPSSPLQIPSLAASCRQTSQLTVLHHRLADPLGQRKHPQHLQQDGPHGPRKKPEYLIARSQLRGCVSEVRSHSIFWMDPRFCVSAKRFSSNEVRTNRLRVLSLYQNNCLRFEANMEIPTKTLKMAVLESWRGLVS